MIYEKNPISDIQPEDDFTTALFVKFDNDEEFPVFKFRGNEITIDLTVVDDLKHRSIQLTDKTTGKTVGLTLRKLNA